MGILIKGGRVIDPDTKRDEVTDIYIQDGIIQEVGDIEEEKEGQALDASGCYVMPGLIDLHVHFRDPGQENKEDIATGGKAAAKGGFTTVMAMPNTIPAIDTPSRVNYVCHKAEEMSPIRVLQAGAITKGQKGTELADIEGMIQAGIPAISEDGKSVMDAQLYREAMEIAQKRHIPVMAHCEDATMARDGCMNDDEKAKELGLPGIGSVAENVIVARDIFLAQDTGVHLHLCHCSTKESVKMLKMAKEQGLPVTGEVCPHHFTLCSGDIPGDNPNYKMNPPLRGREDKEALIQALKEDVVDVISTDHAPHTAEEKSGSMRDAPFGVVGLETSVALVITELVDKGILTPMQMAEKMSYNPARVIHLDRGSLREGKAADVVVIDPEDAYTIDAGTFVSKARNTPFQGRKVKGRVKATIYNGDVVYQYEAPETEDGAGGTIKP